MIALDIYGKIEKTLVSNKLKLYLNNIPTDWKEGIKNSIYEEIRQINFQIKEQLLMYGKSFFQPFDLEHAQKIVKKNIKEWKNYSLETLDECINCIVDNLIYIEFDYEYEDMPFFDWTSNCFDGRLCEEDYSEKIINLINFINKEDHTKFHFNIVYSSNNDYISTIPLITPILSLRYDCVDHVFPTTEQSMQSLISYGQSIDRFLQSENDYYKLDYIIESINKKDDYKHYHFLRSFTLLELLLLSPDQRTSEIDFYLNPIIKKIYSDSPQQATTLLRQMRNKIGHGDFKSFNKKAELFAQIYMKNYSFDYSELSRINWILLHTCCLLDDIIKEVLRNQFQ